MNPHRANDLAILAKLLDVYDDSLGEDLYVKFDDMRKGLVHGTYSALSTKQRTFARTTLERFEPSYMSPEQLAAIPRGREVKSMVGPLPKRPPQRRTSDG
jgi:hypothetical protein